MTKLLKPLFAAATLFAAWPSIARADAAWASPDPAPPAAADEPKRSEGDPTQRQIDRTWLYADDARVAAPMTVVATSSLSYTSVASSPSRIVDPADAPRGCTSPCSSYNALGGNTAVPGGMLAVGGELGLIPHLSLTATAQVGVGGADSVPSPSIGALVGLRVQLLPSSFRHLHIALSGGYLREAWQGPIYVDATDTWKAGSPNGDNGAWLCAAISGDIGSLRLAGAVYGEHVFADARDPLDIMVQAGASYAIVGTFRAGFEYVGQDVEETFANGAEGGARHILGPIASLQLLNERLSLVAGPAIGLTARSPDVLGRVAASFAF
jgi:hypothetical protein